MENNKTSDKKPHVGKNIKRFRNFKGLSLDAIAQLFGKDISWASRLEKKETVEDEFLIPISQLLNIDIEILKNFVDDCDVIFNVDNNNGYLAKEQDIEIKNDMKTFAAELKPLYDEIKELTVKNALLEQRLSKYEQN